MTVALITAIAAFCFVTALLDMGMNGSGNADWAPWGMGIALIGALVAANI